MPHRCYRLKVQLAKKAEAKPKQIKVNVGSEKALESEDVGKAAEESRDPCPGGMVSWEAARKRLPNFVGGG